MSADLYLVSFDEDKPYVSVSIPACIEDRLPYDITDYRKIFNADLSEKKSPYLNFYKNISARDIEEEIRSFFLNFFRTFDELNDPQILISLGWKAKIHTEKDLPETVDELRFEDFRKEINKKIKDLLQNSDAI